MKAKKGPKARVVAPYNYQNDPVTRGVPGLSKGPSIKVTRKNTTTDTDKDGSRKTKVDWSKGADQPFEDLRRQLGDLKGFKQAEMMTKATDVVLEMIIHLRHMEDLEKIKEEGLSKYTHWFTV